MNEDDMILLELTLKRFITADGQMNWLMETPPKYSPLDAIGLLVCGILKINEEMSLAQRRRDDQ
jgi:hypothetical protein